MKSVDTKDVSDALYQIQIQPIFSGLWDQYKYM